MRNCLCHTGTTQQCLSISREICTLASCLLPASVAWNKFKERWAQIHIHVCLDRVEQLQDITIITLKNLNESCALDSFFILSIDGMEQLKENTDNNTVSSLFHRRHGIADHARYQKLQLYILCSNDMEQIEENMHHSFCLNIMKRFAWSRHHVFLYPVFACDSKHILNWDSMHS